MAVLLTALRRAGAPDERLATTLIRYDADRAVEEIEVETRERPAMITVPEYQAKFGRQGAA